MDIKLEVARLREKNAANRAKIKWLVAQHDKIKDLPEASWCGDRLDFDRLPHKDVIKVIRALGGKWSKTRNTEVGKVDYQTDVAGVQVRCWAGEAPPSCKLIEVEEHVPEQVIPAHTRKVMKMHCQPALPAVIAVAQSKAAAPTPDEVPF